MLVILFIWHLQQKLFVTKCLEKPNIDHNPGSTKLKESFHGTDISLLQHPTFEGEEVNRNIVLAEESENDQSCPCQAFTLMFPLSPPA